MAVMFHNAILHSVLTATLTLNIHTVYPYISFKREYSLLVRFVGVVGGLVLTYACGDHAKIYARISRVFTLV